MSYRTPRFWLWLSAIALGTYIGLSLGAGDQDPDAKSFPLLPDKTLTPGDSVDVSLKALCTPGYSKTARHVSEATKKHVFASYGFTGKETRFEIDHLISLELGGSNSEKNLWPQAFTTDKWNASTKDALENRLHWLVCHNRITLTMAQSAIIANWQSAYQMFVVENKDRF